MKRKPVQLSWTVAMLTTTILLSKKLPLPISVVLLGCSAWGCGDDSGVGKTYPVAGKVMIGNVPLTARSTIVLFKPDASRGNSSSFEPSGTVDADGYYTLQTRGKRGARPGWYKVIVTAHDDSPPSHPKTPQHRPAARSLVPAKYGLAKTSDLSIEVVENPAPGAYDLKLTQ
jgi:hypothetical protein